ncbi:hypothetical protein K474DRAFT_950378 [Panus rudis PR-1116 ss-1]|nr:hypothetical protein K474DRAFT_950378 [Panus rudis PR-1116 ss-1]
MPMFVLLEARVSSEPAIQGSPRLPIELIELIIDHLHDDGDALRACKQVSRSFLPRTRFQLFHTITLSPRNLPVFLAIIGASPFIAGVVHDLTINHPFASLFLTYVDAEENLEIRRQLAMITPMLTNVEVLRIRGHVGGRADYIVELKGVKELHLHECVISKLSDFADIMYSFPKLQAIHCTVSDVGRGVVTSVKPPAGWAPRKLAFVNTRIDPYLFIPWLIGHESL